MMFSRKTHLKMKICSLAAEAVVIRREERKWYGLSPMRTSLHEHRVNDVRVEARCALLAYGFLRGRSYRIIESSGTRKRECKGILWVHVLRMIKKYSGEDVRVIRQRFAEWMDAAELSKEMKCTAQSIDYVFK